jgi:hypothetical protein
MSTEYAGWHSVPGWTTYRVMRCGMHPWTELDDLDGHDRRRGYLTKNFSASARNPS